jgi:hypothetical protein
MPPAATVGGRRARVGSCVRTSSACWAPSRRGKISKRHEGMTDNCARCQGERWICERHPDRSWPHDDCAGPGEPCPACNTDDPPQIPSGFQSIVTLTRLVRIPLGTRWMLQMTDKLEQGGRSHERGSRRQRMFDDGAAAFARAFPRALEELPAGSPPVYVCPICVRPFSADALHERRLPRGHTSLTEDHVPPGWMGGRQLGRPYVQTMQQRGGPFARRPHGER